MKKKSFKKINIMMLLTIFILISLSLVTAENNRQTLDEYQKENTYILAFEKDVDTTINGDLFLLTAESNIQGTINKDLNAISNKIRIQGIIGDDLRIIAAEADINAYVFGELRAITSKLKTSNTTIINGKTNIKASQAEIQGTYHEEVNIKSDKIKINALIKADTTIKSRNIEISEETRILGNLEVPEGTKVPNNTVAGQITYIELRPETKTTRELLTNKITLFLIITILSAFLMLIAKNRTNEVIDNSINKKPLLSLLIGVLSLFLLPIISLISLVSLITAPIGALLLMALLAILIITPALAVLMVGKQTLEMIRPRREIRLEIIIGALIIVVLSFIPGFLTIAMFLLYALFLGTIIRILIPKKKKRNKKSKSKKTIITTTTKKPKKKTTKKKNKK